MNDRLVWIDCEMTGLDIERDALIEIACVVTDGQLTLLDGGLDLIIQPPGEGVGPQSGVADGEHRLLAGGIDLISKPPAEALDQMSGVVREMHTKSGLLADLSGG